MLFVNAANAPLAAEDAVVHVVFVKPEPSPVGRILRGICYSPALKAMIASSPVCKSFSMTVLLGFCDFKNRAVCKARSFRSQYLRGMPSLEI